MRLTLAALAACLALTAVPSARAATWSEVFASVPDTMVFLGEDGALLRAPFSLATRETLWLPEGGQHVVRLRVSPDGRRVAWLTRVAETDTTRLWVDGPTGAVLRVRFFALVPDRYGRVHSEPGVPTIEDHEVRGGRLLQPGALMRRLPVNTLEWTPDSRAVVFGYDDGIAAVPADGGAGFGVSKALAVGLVALEPAPIYLVDAIVLRNELTFMPQQGAGTNPAEAPGIIEDGQEWRPVSNALELAHPDVLIARGAVSGTYLIYPMAHRWRVFTASDLNSARHRAASPGTVWWATGDVIHAVRTADPSPTTEVRARTAVTWLGYDEPRRALAWAAGREVGRKPEDGGEATTVLRTSTPIRAGLAAGREGPVAFVTADSLVLWRPQDDAVRRYGLGGLKPTALIEGPSGEALVVTGGQKQAPPGLARADSASGRLVPLEVPAVKGGRFTVVARGAFLLLYDPAQKAPASLHVYDVRANLWRSVANPGITAWEPLEPR